MADADSRKVGLSRRGKGPDLGATFDCRWDRLWPTVDPIGDDEGEGIRVVHVPGNPTSGSFVGLRARPWLVEAVNATPGAIPTLSLSCISDDAQGESLEVIWDAEVGARVLDDDGWASVGQGLPDQAEVLAAHLRAIRWRSATAADRRLLAEEDYAAGLRDRLGGFPPAPC